MKSLNLMSIATMIFLASFSATADELSNYSKQELKNIAQICESNEAFIEPELCAIAEENTIMKASKVIDTEEAAEDLNAVENAIEQEEIEEDDFEDTELCEDTLGVAYECDTEDDS